MFVREFFYALTLQKRFNLLYYLLKELFCKGYLFLFDF